MTICDICNDNKWLYTNHGQIIPCECLKIKWINDFIKRSGIPDRYVSASLSMVYPPLLKVLPETWHQVVEKGELPDFRKSGFIISSPVPCGKSSAAGLYMLRIFQILAERQIRPNNPSYQYIWCNWASEFEWFQQNCINSEDLNKKHTAFSNACLVILDNFGSEPLRKDKIGNEVSIHDSFAFKQLNRIVATRYEKGKTTIVTTNLSKNQLFEKYGESLFNKLIKDLKFCEIKEKKQ